MGHRDYLMAGSGGRPVRTRIRTANLNLPANSTTPVTDPSLVIAISAAGFYRVSALIRVVAGVTSTCDLQVVPFFSGTFGASSFMRGTAIVPTATAYESTSDYLQRLWNAPIPQGIVGPLPSVARYEGILAATSGGSVEIQFAQLVATADVVRIVPGTSVEVESLIDVGVL